jgi:hypothetical protein
MGEEEVALARWRDSRPACVAHCCCGNSWVSEEASFNDDDDNCWQLWRRNTNIRTDDRGSHGTAQYQR